MDVHIFQFYILLSAISVIIQRPEIFYFCRWRCRQTPIAKAVKIAMIDRRRLRFKEPYRKISSFVEEKTLSAIDKTDKLNNITFVPIQIINNNNQQITKSILISICKLRRIATMRKLSIYLHSENWTFRFRQIKYLMWLNFNKINQIRNFKGKLFTSTPIVYSIFSIILFMFINALAFKVFPITIWW